MGRSFFSTINYTNQTTHTTTTNSSTMDFVKKFAGQEQSAQQGSAQQVPAQQGESGGFLGGIGNKLNAALAAVPKARRTRNTLTRVSTSSKRSSWGKDLKTKNPP